jgi:hypothetical protein
MFYKYIRSETLDSFSKHFAELLSMFDFHIQNEFS